MRADSPTRLLIFRHGCVSRFLSALFLLLPIYFGFSPGGFAGDPGELFVKACAPCHSKDGKAQTPAARKLGVKDLSLSTLSDEEIGRQIREGKLKAKDSKMPAFKEKLTDEEIKTLVEMVKSFRKK